MVAGVSVTEGKCHVRNARGKEARHEKNSESSEARTTPAELGTTTGRELHQQLVRLLWLTIKALPEPTGIQTSLFKISGGTAPKTMHYRMSGSVPSKAFA